MVRSLVAHFAGFHLLRNDLARVTFLGFSDGRQQEFRIGFLFADSLLGINNHKYSFPGMYAKTFTL